LAPALNTPAGFDLDAYRESLLGRFANPHLRHRCAQIAMDGTEKIRQRWLPTLRQLPTDSLLLRALAAWCYYVLCTEGEIDDPRGEQLLALRGDDQPLAARLQALLTCLGLSTDDEAQRLSRVERLGSHCELLARGGVSALLAESEPKNNP
jgi:fructuronate reductase